MQRQNPLQVSFIVLGILGALFFVIPLFSLVLFAPWQTFFSQITSPRVLSALRISLFVSAWCVVVSLLFGFPLAWLFTRTEFRGKNLLRTMIHLPIVFPPVVAGVALLGAFGRQGILAWLFNPLGILLPFSFAGAVIAAAFVSAPFLIISLEAGLQAVDKKLEQAAQTLGASPWQVLFYITLPAMKSSIAAGCALCFGRALGEFGATITFAGNLPNVTQTLPLAVYETLQTNWQGALLLSLVLLMLSFAVLFSLRKKIFPVIA